jgi:hypothetical protein
MSVVNEPIMLSFMAPVKHSIWVSGWELAWISRVVETRNKAGVR